MFLILFITLVVFYILWVWQNGIQKGQKTNPLIFDNLCQKKRREIQTVGCQKKSTPYKFFTQILSLVLLNKPSIFPFMISSVVVSHTTAFFSFPEKKKDENKGEWEKSVFFFNLRLCTQQLYIERLKWTQWYVIDNFIGHMSALVRAEDGKFLFWSSDSKRID